MSMDTADARKFAMRRLHIRVTVWCGVKEGKSSEVVAIKVLMVIFHTKTHHKGQSLHVMYAVRSTVIRRSLSLR